jgi:hypothetical protein
VRSTQAESESQVQVTHMGVQDPTGTPHRPTSALSQVAEFNTQRKAARALASAFQCPLIAHVTGASHVNKAEPRQLQLGDLKLLGLPPGLEHLVGVPKAVCTKCVNRAKHLRRKVSQEAGKENTAPQQPDLAVEVAALRKKLQKAEERAQKATNQSKALKRKMSGSSKNGKPLPSPAYNL